MPRSTGSTSTPTCRATATSGTGGATSRPDSRTSAGRTPGTPSPTATAAYPDSRGRPPSSRATPTTRRCAAPGWPVTSGRTRRSPTGSSGRRPTSSAASTAILGRGRRVLRARARHRGQQVDALASNNGHLLWSGIVDKSKAKAVARHLLGPRLFSGWGVRTLAEGEARYNPIGYHVGTVWPFDNSFIAWGLRRYGFKEEAARIAAGNPRRRRVLRRAPPRGIRRLRAQQDELSGGIPDGLQPAGVVRGRAAALPAHHARPRADRRPPHRRPGDPGQHRAGRAARHPRPLGPHRRLRARTQADGEDAIREASWIKQGVNH